MKSKANVVDLNECRELLKDWNRVRDYILTGKVKGWAICFLDYKNREGVHLGGVFKRSPNLALKASLHISMEMNAGEPPPEFQETTDSEDPEKQ